MAAEPQCKEFSAAYLTRILIQCLRGSFRLNFVQGVRTITVMYEASKRYSVYDPMYVIFTEDNMTWHRLDLKVVDDVVLVGSGAWTHRCFLREVACSVPMSRPLPHVLLAIFQDLFRGTLRV